MMIGSYEDDVADFVSCGGGMKQGGQQMRAELIVARVIRILLWKVCEGVHVIGGRRHDGGNGVNEGVERRRRGRGRGRRRGGGDAAACDGALGDRYDARKKICAHGGRAP